MRAATARRGRSWRHPAAGLFAPVVCRVVGIAEDAKFGNLREAPPRTIYFPMTPDLADGNLVFLLNAPTKAAAISAIAMPCARSLPTVPLVVFVTLREQMEAGSAASAPSRS